MLPGKVLDLCKELMANSGDVNTISLMWNLLHEHRIPDGRGAVWAEQVEGPLQYSLEAAFRVYGDAVEANAAGTYLRRGFNGANMPRPDNSNLPAPGDLLVHVLDLTNRLSMNIWRFGKDAGIEGIQALDLASAASLSRGLALLLGDPDRRRQRPIMQAFFEARTEYLAEHRPHGPTWVVLQVAWQRTTIDDSPDSWAASVGLCKPHPGRWLAVLGYPVRHAGQLLRPTQLEAGWFGRHFPSPPCCGCESGGRVVQGAPVVQAIAGHARAEFLHAPVRWSEHHWLTTGLPVLQTRDAVGPVRHLRSDRESHFTALSAEFGDSNIFSWMKVPNP